MPTLPGFPGRLLTRVKRRPPAAAQRVSAHPKWGILRVRLKEYARPLFWRYDRFAYARTRETRMSEPVQEGAVRTDDEGYLVDPSDWNPQVAQLLAGREGVELGDDHWAVLHFMRQYYDDHQVPADARFVIRFLAKECGKGDEARDVLFALFPYGYVKQACKIAGMRRPRVWSTG